MRRLGRWLVWAFAIVGVVAAVRFAVHEVEPGSASNRAKRQAAAAAAECRHVAREAEAGKVILNAGNYYLRCLKPGVDRTALVRKAEARRARESAQTQKEVAREEGEREAQENVRREQQERIKTQTEERLRGSG
jgi:hypothetical protein